MRRMIATAMLLVAGTAQSAEQLKFGDINYFLQQGQFNLLADVNSSFEKQRVGSEDVEVRGVILSTQLAYAFTDQFNAFVGLDYAYDREFENKTDPTTTDYTSDGLSNPALGVNYRLLNQNDSRYNLDLGAVARINIEDAEDGDAIPGNSKDGNFAESRSSLEANVRLGRKFDIANEWQLAAGAVYFTEGERTVNGIGGDVKSDDESSIDYYLRASYQYRPVNEFMMLISAQATRVGEMDEDVKGVGSLTHDSHIDLEFRFTAKYLITDNFIAKFNYSQSRNSNYDVEDTEVKNRRAHFFGLGVDYLF